MTFNGIDVPFELVPFSQMNKKQAKQYFDWFIDTMDERLQILQRYLKDEGSSVKLDKTPESLIGLWEWFMDRIEMVPKTEEEIRAELDARPEWMHKHVLENPRKFSIQTFLLAYNIAAYFGEVVIAKHPKIYWGYLTTPKKLHGVNSPRLMGFKADMSEYVYGKVETYIWKTLDEPNSMYLYNGYIKSKNNIV